MDDGSAGLFVVVCVRMTHAAGQHGGPDRSGVAECDFSTCANAAAPHEALRQRIAMTDATRYPDPEYHALRERLAVHHAVSPHRVLLAASASEFIQRITRVVARLSPGGVAVPLHAYADYERAARAHGLPVRGRDVSHAGLRWACEPSSPLGGDEPPLPQDGEQPTVLDAVYEPLRLNGASTWRAARRDAVFVLHGPNKVLAMTGVRGAYAVAPDDARWQPWVEALQAAAPSWPLGAHAVTMLQAWCEPATHAGLATQLDSLRQWKQRFQSALRSADIEYRDSCTPFFLLRLPPRIGLDRLRRAGLKLRDTTSFGLPGWARVNTLPEPAQDTLLRALTELPP
jgi:histidinol-phosphate aminotransferase